MATRTVVIIGGGIAGLAAAVRLIRFGVKPRAGAQAIGTTDELGMNIVDRPVSVPDLFATILATLGIDYSEQLYAGSRPVPVTDMGAPIAELFSVS